MSANEESPTHAPVFIWTDIGTNPDDTLAILMVLRSKEINIAGISTCFDENGSRVRLLRYILQSEGKSSIPIAQGKSCPVCVERRIREYLGPVISSNECYQEGSDLFQKSLNASARMDVISLGPLTDFAGCVKSMGVLDQGKICLSAMGGALDGDEEYNFSSDPDAVSIVLNSPFPKRVVPLDLTRQFFLKENDIGRLNLSDDMRNLILYQWNRWKDWSGRENLFLNDPMAVACSIGLESFSFKKMRIKINKKGDPCPLEFLGDPDSNLEIATGVDRGEFFELFYSLLG